MRVYILSDYDEHGSENVRATLDKSKLEGILAKMYTGWRNQTQADILKLEALSTLKALLQIDKVCSESGETLTSGWGGAMLHIVELE